LKAWIAAAVAVAALAAALTLTAGVSQAHDQPVQNDCLSHIVDPPASGAHTAVMPTFTNVTQTSLTVNWLDRCNNEDNFQVLRGGVVIATLAANTTSYNDSGLTCDTTYTYVIRALRTTPAASDDSLPANVTTAACGPPPPASCPTGNHGQYVSCVARNESSPPGKGPVVKDAAQSDEGKPNP
jgi:hypothetical protein